MSAPVAVTFMPSGVTAWVQPGTSVLDAARCAGVTLVAPCGGRGICCSCGVRVVDGALQPPDEIEEQALVRAPAGVRLACRARVSGPVSVRPLVHATVESSHSTPSEGELVVGVDLGTTNVAALAVEARGGREVARSTIPNAQAAWGSDVLSRVAASIEGASGELRDAAVDSVVSAVVAAGDDPARVSRIVVSGNTVMAGLLSGVDLDAIAVAPYPAPVIPRQIRLAETPLAHADVIVVPPVASFVGGDVLAGAVHTGLLYADRPAMLVDIGTNAEVLLASGGRLWAASAPAGPAFEGGGIECGGPAVRGAVVSVEIADDGSIELSTLEDAPPRWFSGAGLLSALGELRRLGHLRPDGLLESEGALEPHFHVSSDGVQRVRLGGESGCLTLSQLDIRSLQLAKAAVRVGVEMVLAEAGLAGGELADIHVAGAFGGAVSAASLVNLGVVPASVSDAVRHAGNASLAGAAAMALDPGTLDDAVGRAAGVRHVELATNPAFASALMRAVTLEPYDA